MLRLVFGPTTVNCIPNQLLILINRAKFCHLYLSRVTVVQVDNCVRLSFTEEELFQAVKDRKKYQSPVSDSFQQNLRWSYWRSLENESQP